MVLSGTLRERVGRREVTARPLSIVLKPLDTEHSDTFGTTPVHLIRITLSDADSASICDLLPARGRWRWTAGGAATRTFLSLVGECGVSSDPTGSVVERLVWDTFAALTAPHDDRDAAPPGWLIRAREELDDSAVPPRLSELAGRAGIHPVYLARQFRRFFGRSVSGYIHSLRVRRAAELIACDRVSLSRAAAEAGFADQPHLCRIFLREAGVTPAHFRRAVAQVQSVQDGE
jgi:AraC family transcriptional regulator